MPQRSTKRTNVTEMVLAPFLLILIFATGCKNVIDRQQNVTPRVLRDVPARNLAYRLAPDVSPPSADIEDSDKFAAVANHFSTKRKDEALMRTVVSPDGRRVLALYGTTDDTGSTFRIDLYNSDGEFLRNLIPPDLACVFPETVTWSPDGNFINFIERSRVRGRRRQMNPSLSLARRPRRRRRSRRCLSRWRVSARSRSTSAIATD